MASAKRSSTTSRPCQDPSWITAISWASQCTNFSQCNLILSLFSSKWSEHLCCGISSLLFIKCRRWLGRKKLHLHQVPRRPISFLQFKETTHRTDQGLHDGCIQINVFTNFSLLYQDRIVFSTNLKVSGKLEMVYMIQAMRRLVFLLTPTSGCSLYRKRIVKVCTSMCTCPLNSFAISPGFA